MLIPLHVIITYTGGHYHVTLHYKSGLSTRLTVNGCSTLRGARRIAARCSKTDNVPVLESVDLNGTYLDEFDKSLDELNRKEQP